MYHSANISETLVRNGHGYHVEYMFLTYFRTGDTFL